tara:strand:- start:25 stop:426 length:402 start_codon:yes stop_codon:yes gene_type:complete
MAKPEWGRKRTCQVCGKKYYDFNKSPIICPCPEAVEFDPDLLLRSRKGRGLSSKAIVVDNDLSENISNIDDIENETDDEVVSDDDPLVDINKEDQKNIPEDEVGINEDINFIEDDEITEDNSINVEVIDEDKE